jgi:hypothetical protein
MAGKPERCFACDKKLGRHPAVADTRDDQAVYVGSECYKLIRAAGEAGYQPPKGGPRLWVMSPEGWDHYAESSGLEFYKDMAKVYGAKSKLPRKEGR